MYQGKFDSENKQTQRSVYELVAERNAKKAARPAPKQAASRQRPAEGSGMTGMDPIRGRTAPASGRAPAPQSSGRAPARQASGRTAVAEAPLPKKKRTGTLVFYTVCMGFVFVFYVATFFGLKYLNNWLTRFESAQPTAKSAAVFEELFTVPDWDALYDRAGMTIGKDSFRQVMEEKVGS